MIRIILKNMDKKNYGIYGFSMALFSSIIYIVASLISINGIINLGAGSENVRIVFAFYYVVIACTGLLFIFYALNFYIKSRMKDYAMLIVLGISKRRTFAFLIFEFIFIFLAGTLAGLVTGMVVIEIISKLFCANGITVDLSFQEIVLNLRMSFLFSLGICVFGCILGLLYFLKRDLTKIMTIGVKRENRYHWLSILAVLGLALLFVSVDTLKEATFGKLLLSLLENIIGMYILFSFGLSFIISFVQRFLKKIYIKFLLNIKNFVYRYKSNRMIIFITYVLNIIIIFFAGGMIITSYMDTSMDESATVIQISSYFMAIFTIVCNMGILSIKQMNDRTSNKEWTEILRYLGMDSINRKKFAISEFKVLVIIPTVLSNFFVWFYILAECKRVELMDLEHVASFIIFQLILIIIQTIYFKAIKQYTIKTERCEE